MSSLYPGIKIVGNLNKKDKELLQQASEVLLHFETSIDSKIEVVYNANSELFEGDFPQNESSIENRLNIIIVQMRTHRSSSKPEIIASLLMQGFEDMQGYNGQKFIEPFRNFPQLKFLSASQNVELKQILDKKIRFVEDNN